MTNDILTNIQNKLKLLSKGQKRIAQYILDSCDKAAFQTAGMLGKTVQVSESTVVRFAVELGYSGYPEMQRALQEVVLTRLNDVQRVEVGDRQMSQEDAVSSVLQDDIDCIRTTVEELDRTAFEGAVNALLQARRIYILGVQSTSAIALFLNYYFRYIFDDVRLLTVDSASEVMQQLVRISPQDTLLCISFPRYSSTVTSAMLYGRNAGAKTIALTDCASSPLAENADYLLTAKSNMVSFADSMVAPMSVINALIVAVASRRRQETAETFEKLEEIWDTYHVYEKNEE